MSGYRHYYRIPESINFDDLFGSCESFSDCLLFVFFKKIAITHP